VISHTAPRVPVFRSTSQREESARPGESSTETESAGVSAMTE